MSASEIYLPVAGVMVDREDLTLLKARAVANVAARNLPFVRFVECRRASDGSTFKETIVIDAEVEVPQYPVYDIRSCERIAISFDLADAYPPEVLALRTDFPLVPHLNLRHEEYPRSLCLSDEPYAEQKLQWTPLAFVERIREWLALTARGEAHGQDQPLEPLLVGAPFTLVVPPGLALDVETPFTDPLAISIAPAGNGRILLANLPGPQDSSAVGDHQFVATVMVGRPQTHGVIRRSPGTLAEAHEVLLAAGIDLCGSLRERLRGWQQDRVRANILDAHLILIVALPKTRETAGEVEAIDLRAFLCGGTMRDVGAAMGLWETHGGHIGTLLSDGSTTNGANVADVDVQMLNLVQAFSRELAARLGGMTAVDARAIVAVGVGALGSQIFMNLTRLGYGNWTLVDPDVMLPHNLGRHALAGPVVGMFKAHAMAALANATINGPPIAASIAADITVPLNDADLQQRIEEAAVILDMSASVAIARYVARDIDASGRRVSLFLSPSGRDLVLLAEDAARRIPLDALEMQYYRLLLTDSRLRDHLPRGGGRLRYALSCRDLSSVIPGDLVAQHAATGSRALRTVLARDDATIIIWRDDPVDCSLTPIRIRPAAVIVERSSGWTLCVDQGVINKLADQRTEGLPGETGGVLVGAHDTQRSILYVVDVVPSPPDSQQWPTSYIRGSSGLRERIKEIEEITAGRVGYVGEWHSHPDGLSCAPSVDDRRAFAWLAEQMETADLPALMAIVGAGGECAWYLGKMV